MTRQQMLGGEVFDDQQFNVFRLRSKLLDQAFPVREDLAVDSVGMFKPTLQGTVAQMECGRRASGN